MQQIAATSATTGIARQRAESLVETLPNLPGKGESLAEIAHDARNMVMALILYCDLLEEPGVLAPAFAHYGAELRLVAGASRRLVDKLLALDHPTGPPLRRHGTPETERWSVPLSSAPPLAENPQWDRVPPATPVANLADELVATRNLLAALAGCSIALTIETEGCALPAPISCEDLTRIMVNLIKNASEAMPGGGHIQIRLHQPTTGQQNGEPARRLMLTVEDDGPGIPTHALERIFASGYRGQSPAATEADFPAAGHRGLGLAITRSIVETAGGRVYAENRAQGGARLVIELPQPAASSL